MGDSSDFRLATRMQVHHVEAVTTARFERNAMKHWIPATVAIVALGALPALAAESTFDRTLTVSGTVTLHVSTGSGYIHIRQGSDNQVHIIGRVKSHGFSDGEEKVKEIAAHPPIEQTGGIVRIGAHLEGIHNISIDYDIVAPAGAFLSATTGSGDVSDDGVGVDAKLNTGSGTIHATGLKQGFTVDTGSGDIYAEQDGPGDVKANTGSGRIELRNVAGGLRAQTGSGDIKVGGAPKADWKITTGSGSVELTPAKGGFNLEASTGSGSIRTDREMTVQGSVDNHHHMTGKVDGGGPTVRVETGSGDIHIR
jgi:Putative adhesin